MPPFSPSGRLEVCSTTYLEVFYTPPWSTVSVRYHRYHRATVTVGYYRFCSTDRYAIPPITVSCAFVRYRWSTCLPAVSLPGGTVTTCHLPCHHCLGTCHHLCWIQVQEVISRLPLQYRYVSPAIGYDAVHLFLGLGDADAEEPFITVTTTIFYKGLSYRYRCSFYRYLGPPPAITTCSPACLGTILLPAGGDTILPWVPLGVRCHFLPFWGGSLLHSTCHSFIRSPIPFWACTYHDFCDGMPILEGCCSGGLRLPATCTTSLHSVTTFLPVLEYVHTCLPPVLDATTSFHF